MSQFHPGPRCRVWPAVVGGFGVEKQVVERHLKGAELIRITGYVAVLLEEMLRGLRALADVVLVGQDWM